MRPASAIFVISSFLSATLATPVAVADAALDVSLVPHVGEQYKLLHRDLPEDLLAEKHANLTTYEYHELLSKRGCDPIGCYANGFFSVTFNAGGNNFLRLFGEGQPQQDHALLCSDTFSGFNSWLPYVFSSRAGRCGTGLIRYCCNSYDQIFFFYASINTRPSGDTRCANTGGTTGRCIFPIRP